MTYQESIDMEMIRTWVKADRGIITEVARDLKRGQSSVSKTILGYHKNPSAQVLEKVLEKIVERQSRMIGYMAKIRQNAEIIQQMQL